MHLTFDSTASWSTALECALDTRVPHPFEILTGKQAQLAPDNPSLTKETRKSCHLLSYLHATIHVPLNTYIISSPNAHAAYQSPYKTFAVHAYNASFEKFHK